MYSARSCPTDQRLVNSCSNLAHKSWQKHSGHSVRNRRRTSSAREARGGMPSNTESPAARLLQRNGNHPDW